MIFILPMLSWGDSDGRRTDSRKHCGSPAAVSRPSVAVSPGKEEGATFAFEFQHDWRNCLGTAILAMGCCRVEDGMDLEAILAEPRSTGWVRAI
jgi:hypothetical protein